MTQLVKTLEWSTSSPDWADRLQAGQPPIEYPVLFPEAADYALDIFKRLKIVDMIGRPTIGEVTRPWALDYARAFFGSMNDEENVRYISEFMLLIAKKNTKSTIAAGIMLTVLILNLRDSGEFLILAPTKEAAQNAFQPARDMIRADEDLDTLFLVQEHIKTITHRETNAKLKVIAADSDTVSGTKAIGILVDELWAFGKKAKARSMLTEATGGIASKPEGFVMYLTTHSDEPPAGIMREKLLYARSVRDGRIHDPRFMPVLYEFPPDMLEDGSYKNPGNWFITNPNLNASVDLDYLKRKMMSAEEGGEESVQQVLSKHLNVEVGMNLQSNRWAGADFWEETEDETITFETLLERCEVICIGIDGGGLDDLLGISVLGREKETTNWLSWSHAWVHEIGLERRKSEAPKMHDFSDEGSLEIVRNVGDDVAGVVAYAARVFQADLLHMIGVDPIGIGAILDAFEEAEIPEDKIIGISQGWKLGGTIKTTERRLAAGTLKHDSTELMTWCVSNARIEDRANSILVTKQASGKGKIDPLMAMYNAVALMEKNPSSMTANFRLMVL